MQDRSSVGGVICACLNGTTRGTFFLYDVDEGCIVIESWAGGELPWLYAFDSCEPEDRTRCMNALRLGEHIPETNDLWWPGILQLSTGPGSES